MKKIMKVITAVMLLASLVLPLSNAKAQTTLESIKEKGQLVVGTSADYPPFEWISIEDGQEEIIGADIDLAQKIADEIGVELVIENMGFDGLIPSLKTNRVDILIAGMGYTEDVLSKLISQHLIMKQQITSLFVPKTQNSLKMPQLLLRNA